MSITLFGISVNPGDNGTLYDAGLGNQSVTPVLSMVAGDLVHLHCTRRSLDAIVMGATGGQSWTAGTLRQTGSSSTQVFWCRFNGTWAANPSIVTIANSSILITIAMIVGRPTSGTNTWAIDVAEQNTSYGAPVTPFDVTRAGQTTLAASTLSIATFVSLDNNTWGLPSPALWANAGVAQYRNDDTGAFRDMSVSFGYQIRGAAGATGNLTNRQLTLGGDAGNTQIVTYKEQTSGVTIASAGDALFHDGDIGIALAGTSFGATPGTSAITISPTNNILDAGAVTQTITGSWSDTLASFTAVRGALPYFTPLYLFLKNNAGQSNASGFPVQFEAWANIAAVLKSLAGATVNSVSGIDYRMTAVGINGALLISGATASTDGSGNVSIPTYVLTSGGPLAPGDDVWVELAKNGATQALSFATSVKVTPTYT